MPEAALPLLYSYRRCPYAMRARMALLQAGRRFEAFEIVLRDKPAALLRLSPKGTVPVLQLPGGTVLEESWHIMRWAFETDDASGKTSIWWARAQAPENLALLQANDGPFKRALDRYKYPERHTAEGLPREAHRAQADAMLLKPLAARLQQAPWLGGAQPCATDLALFPFVRQFAAVDSAWFEANMPMALQAWLAAWVASDLFTTCMHKLPPQQAVAFPGMPA